MPNIVPRLLKETTGETLFDKFVLNLFKGHLFDYETNASNSLRQEEKRQVIH